MVSALERKNVEYGKKMGIVGQEAYIASLNRVVRVGLTVAVAFERRLEGERRQCRYLG